MLIWDKWYFEQMIINAFSFVERGEPRHFLLHIAWKWHEARPHLLLCISATAYKGEAAAEPAQRKLGQLRLSFINMDEEKEQQAKPNPYLPHSGREGGRERER